MFSERAVAWGHAEACGRLAWALLSSDGCRSDPFRAALLANKGAEQDDLTSLAILGYCYVHGWGVKRDPTLGFSLASRSADLGNMWGVFIVAACYLQGDGVEQNPGIAVDMLQYLAKQEFIEGVHTLGTCYQLGVSYLPKDLGKAVALYRQVISLQFFCFL